MIDASCDAKALLTEVIAIRCLSMSPSARCVYGCEKLRGRGEAGALRFLAAKQPSGMALKLLSIVKKHGLQVLA